MKRITIVGVPSDYGQMRRGVDMGPSAIRYAGIHGKLQNIGHDVEDIGDIIVPRSHLEESGKLRNLNAIIQTNEQLFEMVDHVMSQKRIPVVLGGDHSIAIGTIAGVAKHVPDLGVIWFDAHGDANTAETTPSGNIHGMSVAISLGYGQEDLVKLGGYTPKIKLENIVLIGIRSLDPGEKVFFRENNIRVYTMQDIDRRGMAVVMEEAIAYLDKKCSKIHLSLDPDALDPQDAPGVGTPEPGGITYREGLLAMEILAEKNIVCSVELVEVNPILDERNKTAIVGVELIGSLFGEKLL